TAPATSRPASSVRRGSRRSTPAPPAPGFPDRHQRAPESLEVGSLGPGIPEGAQRPPVPLASAPLLPAAAAVGVPVGQVPIGRHQRWARAPYPPLGFPPPLSSVPAPRRIAPSRTPSDGG